MSRGINITDKEGNPVVLVGKYKDLTEQGLEKIISDFMGAPKNKPVVEVFFAVGLDKNGNITKCDYLEKLHEAMKEEIKKMIK